MKNTQNRTRTLGTIGLVAAGVAGSALVAASMSSTAAAYIAQLTNDTNTAASASFILTEASGTVLCNSSDADGATDNTATCSTINKYGGTATPLTPGGTPNVTTVTMTNNGNVAATNFILTPGACTSTSTLSPAPTSGPGTGNLCTQVNINIVDSKGTVVYDGLASNFTGDKTLINLAPKASETYTFTVSLPASVTDITYQATQISQPLVWKMTSA